MKTIAALVAPLLLAASCAPYYGDRAWDHGGGYWRRPGGSYSETCRSIRVDGRLLKATCRRDDGSWRNTALDLRGCDRAVVNDDGRLRSGRGGPSNIPPGSYARSCADIRVQGGVLRADCRTRDGRWRRNAVRVDACRRFANRDGRLACE
jgi:hypothetical protein